MPQPLLYMLASLGLVFVTLVARNLVRNRRRRAAAAVAAMRARPALFSYRKQYAFEVRCNGMRFPVTNVFQDADEVLVHSGIREQLGGASTIERLRTAYTHDARLFVVCLDRDELETAGLEYQVTGELAPRTLPIFDAESDGSLIEVLTLRNVAISVAYGREEIAATLAAPSPPPEEPRATH